jgi:uridine phosphorylase
VTATTPQIALQDTVIRAAAAQMIFASRTSQAFITPDQVSELEKWTGMVSLKFCQKRFVVLFEID